ncbi:MAG: hypothetical protein IKT50_01635 [Clostridia bacterium]|nr:hypothetical protein [Clostridia bacterium]
MKKKKEKALTEEKEFLEERATAALEDEAEEKEAEPKEEKTDETEKMKEDIALFHRLFPEVKAKDIPEEVWERVEAGESLAASFALHFVQKMKEEEHIKTVNATNEKKAPPRIRHDGAEYDYFSPEAVKSMSRSEIKKNYDAILASMEKWK